MHSVTSSIRISTGNRRCTRGVAVTQLPVAAAAPEYMEQKATIDAIFALAFGLYTYVNPIPTVTGAPNQVKLLTEDLKGLTGGILPVEPDPVKAVDGIAAHRGKEKGAWNMSDDIKGKVIRLDELVEYQDGTVASRMVIKQKHGNITIFSFDEDEGLSEHTAPFDALVTILDGECEIWLEGKTFEMKTGDSIIFPANAPHALSAITKFKMSLTMIKE